MRRVDLIEELDSKVGLSKLIKAGILNINIVRDKDIFFQYDAFSKSGIKSAESLRRLSDTFDLDTRTIQLIVAKMKEE